MSKHALQSFCGSKGTTEQSLHSYQSVWMAHWSCTRHKSTSLAQNQLKPSCKSTENDCNSNQAQGVNGPDSLPDLVKCGKQLCEVAVSGTANMKNESVPMTSGNFMKERLASQPFPSYGLPLNRSDSLSIENDRSTILNGGSVRPPIDVTATPPAVDKKDRALVGISPKEETRSREDHLEFTDTRHDLEMPVKLHSSLEKKSLDVSRSHHDDNSSSGFQGIQDGLKAGGTSYLSSFDKLDGTNRSSTLPTSKEFFRNLQITQMEHDQHDHHTHSALYFGQRRDDNTLHPNTSETALYDTAMLQNDPSTSKNQLSVVLGKKPQMIHDYSNTELFPCQGAPVDMMKLENLYRECSSRPRHSFLDVESMKICTSVDPVKGFSGFQPKVSQTMHHLFFSEKTDVKLSKVGQIIRESIVSAKYEGNTSGEVLRLSPNYNFRKRHGVRLQPLWSSTDSEENEDIALGRASTIAIKNESSAETDTLDMASLQDNHLFGDVSSPVDKDAMMSHKLSLSQAATSSAGEARCKEIDLDLPGKKRNYLALKAMSSSMDEGEPSTSKTQSLDVRRLLSHTHQDTDSKPKTFFSTHLGPEQTNRWLKRLRMSTSESSSRVNKSSKVGEASSSERANNFLGQIKQLSTGSSEPIMDTCAKEQMAFDQSALLTKDSGQSSSDSLGKSRDALLSNPWIRRWCHTKAASLQKKPETIMLCKPQGSKALLDESRKKQFPSVAAMALMGKAMSGFNPSEFRKRGTCMVWSTERL